MPKYMYNGAKVGHLALAERSVANSEERREDIICSLNISVPLPASQLCLRLAVQPYSQEL